MPLRVRSSVTSRARSVIGTDKNSVEMFDAIRKISRPWKKVCLLQYRQYSTYRFQQKLYLFESQINEVERPLSELPTHVFKIILRWPIASCIH